MKTKTNKKIISVVAGALLSVSALVFTVQAGSLDNFTGWAWSDNIGWISFNSSNCDTDNDGTFNDGVAGCPTSGSANNYGVNVDETNRPSGTGDFSGQAWSDNIGWISFDRIETGNPPEAPFDGGSGPIAQIDWTTGAVTGWARALAGNDPAAQPWDGWIKLSGVAMNGDTYGVTLNGGTGALSGYAWGSEVIGWVSFSGPGYGATGPLSLTKADLEPTALGSLVGIGFDTSTGLFNSATVNYVIKNNGQTDASSFDNEMVVTGTSFSETTNFPTPSLAADSDTGTLSHIAAYYIPPGDYTVSLEVDYLDAVVDEGDEGNNNLTTGGTLSLAFPEPNLSLTADPTLVRSGETFDLSWNTNVTYAMDCTVIGLGVNESFDPAVPAEGPTGGVNDVGPITSKSVYTLECTENISGNNEVFSTEIKVETVGTVEEI